MGGDEDPPCVYGLLRATGIVYQLEELETTIGRAEDCSIVLEGRGVSKLHVRLCPGEGRQRRKCTGGGCGCDGGGGWWCRLWSFTGKDPPNVTDLNSCNGTFVNGVRLRPNCPVPLKHGDMLRIGLSKWTFCFELPPPVERPEPAAKAEKERPEKGKVRYSDDAKPPEPAAYGAAPYAGCYGAPAPPQPPAGCYGAPVNVLPVPFPMMAPPMGYPPAAPPAPWSGRREAEAEERRKRSEEESEWKHELLSKLWQLEANIARLADANQEICQAIREQAVSSNVKDAERDVASHVECLEAPPDVYEEEISKAVTALTSAAERLSTNAEILLHRDPGPAQVLMS
eukprot:Skav208556  [mRNA]  locus=scaffold1216:707178:709502:+ [translate_table: standard]